MATVAGIVEILSSRIDKLRSVVDKLDADKKSNGINNRSAAAGDDAKDGMDLSELRLEIETVRKEVRDSRDGHAASLKKERSVSEAVLTQKLDRMVGDKNAILSRKVDQVCETVAKLSEKSVAITAAVDKQAKFLMELNAGIAMTIEKAVERALAQKQGGRGDQVQVQRQGLTPAGETGLGNLGDLEESPDLVQIPDEQRSATVARDDGDQIDMVPVSEDPQTSKKPKAKGRKKIKDTESE